MSFLSSFYMRNFLLHFFYSAHPPYTSNKLYTTQMTRDHCSPTIFFSIFLYCIHFIIQLSFRSSNFTSFDTIDKHYFGSKSSLYLNCHLEMNRVAIHIFTHRHCIFGKDIKINYIVKIRLSHVLPFVKPNFTLTYLNL